MEDKTTFKLISKKIYLKRIEKGYTQSYMAGLLNISQNVYSINERNVKEISLARFLKILEILELSFEDILL
ncbi:helix-turn-helix domain-containing protein [Pedobacter sp. AW31-3R]|uniref:helix-turn-helix domain-containing protein n=1 Tax=Pedobacter sp. AW31-3R TaxID=3445781 RepID=UPI003F9EF78B